MILEARGSRKGEAMKAAMLQSGKLEILDLPTPEPGFEQARVRITSAVPNAILIS